MSIGSIREKGLSTEGGQGRNRVVSQVLTRNLRFRCRSNPAHLPHQLNLETVLEIREGWLSRLPLVL